MSLARLIEAQGLTLTSQGKDLACRCPWHEKALAGVERAFRAMKTIDLHIRAIHHRLENRVRAHIFLCMLAYHVEWHMREAWRELMFADEDLSPQQELPFKLEATLPIVSEKCLPTLYLSRIRRIALVHRRHLRAAAHDNCGRY